jgi:hypothetical protein
MNLRLVEKDALVRDPFFEGVQEHVSIQSMVKLYPMSNPKMGL